MLHPFPYIVYQFSHTLPSPSLPSSSSFPRSLPSSLLLSLFLSYPPPPPPPKGPYIKVYQLYNAKRQHKWKTSIKRSTVMPIFNEPFRFELPNIDIHSVSLEILIMDHNRFSGDEIMGIIRIGDSAPDETGRSHWSEILRTPGQAVSRWHSAWPITHVYDGGSDRDSVLTN